MRRRIRILGWRYRYVLATVLIMYVGLSIMQTLRPDPPGVEVTVAARDLPAGTPIEADDVEVARLPTEPPGVVDPLGLTPVVTIPRGVPLTESMLLGPGLVDQAPPGTVIAPVHVADVSVLDLLRVGDRVDLYTHSSGAGDSTRDSTLVCSGVMVMAIGSDENAGGGPLKFDTPHAALFYGAIPLNEASVFTGAAALAPFQVVVATAS